MKVSSCPSCHYTDTTSTWVDHEFQYGTDEDYVMLKCRALLRTCLHCDEKWLDYISEDIMQEVIDIHLLPTVIDDAWRAAAEKALIKADVFSLPSTVPLLENFKVPIEEMDEWCAQARLDYPCHFKARIVEGLG